ncbi:Alpha-2-macroglobulin family N-terminal region [Serratia entomophila]|uniref:alpha-2-macroglobulin family protein n=1 Tax=Serratia entomophila TaxID=42906 RepID=UPI00217A7A2A|nr:alpha-2-macroglobulin [Serratia entomophila]CAI1097970.1 Alpha-2-macroglobulin family N-terminal region [Serratia entomophila]CAI1934291.1 Alpha-2-macroglobulin family N-terminal region [Serratia entomophila]
MDLLKFILRLPFTLIRGAFRLLAGLLVLLGRLFRPLLGNLNWTAPGWWAALSGGLKRAFLRLESGVDKRPKAVSLALLLLLCAAGGAFYGWHWWQNRPQPIEPAPMVYQQTRVEIAKPEPFNYAAQKSPPQTLSLAFSNSAAPLADVGKAVSKGITLKPAAEGQWRWSNGWTLVFTPKKPLPMGAKYDVELDPAALLAPQIKLANTHFTFNLPAFDYQLGQAEYYQDPQDAQKRSAIFNLKFNAPVDVASFEKQVALGLKEGNAKSEKKLNFSLVYDEKKLNAWVHSEPLKPLDQGGAVHLTVGQGIKALVPANAVGEAKSNWVTVPTLYSLALNDAGAQVVDADGGKGQRALILAFSDAVKDKELANAVNAWLLPQHDPDDAEAAKDPNDFYHWDTDSVAKSVLAQSTPLPLALNEAEDAYQPQFSFRFDAPAHRFVLIEIDNRLTSAGGYKMPKKAYRVVEVPEFPKSLQFMSQGSLLSVNGDKQISVAARNVAGLRLDIKRVIPSQLQHIVSFKSREYSSAEFNRLNDEYFTERFKYQTALNNDQPGEVNYQGIDLSRYLSTNPESHRGVFLLTLSEWQPNQKPAAEGEAEQGEEQGEDSAAVGDSRFVVVTDLGIVAKRSQDKTQDVFVQSIHSGAPVGNAKVSVVAKNGVTLLNQTTDANGHVRFPALDVYTNERQPVMFLVEKEGDVSFLPTGSYNDRGLDFSRFDVAGEETPTDPRALGSYLFSDRGVYRPGDSFNIGLITRAADWGVGLAGVPVRAEVRDPRDKLMATVPLTLGASGFNELSYTTDENSPTGEWSVYLYLIGKNNDTSTLLGHTAVNVKEFEPDQLKVKLELTPDRRQGWVKPSELQANIDVQNLFGTPAQDRRVTSKLTLRPMYPSFDRFPDYAFYENRQNNDGFETELEDRTTDERGAANIPLDLKSYADATYQLQLLSEAFVAGGGRSVAASARALVSPYDYLVGVKADGDLGYINRDAARHLKVIAIDPLLKQIALPGLRQVLIEQKYISVLTKQDSGVYKYQSKMKEVQLSEQPLALSEQGNDLQLATDRPGDFVLAIEDAQGKTLNRVAYSVAGNANLSRSLDRNAELKLKLNQAEYQPGDEIDVAINAPYTGSGLITIEKDRVYAWQWFHTDTTSSVQKIRLPAGMEGNGYINVQFVRDVNSSEIFMSPLSYGVMPFKISTRARQNGLEVTAPAVIKPGEDLTMTVKTDAPQQVALFAVDEGILQVARYRLKDPLEFFFSKRELSVTSSQILDLILPEFSKLMALTAAPGGDAGEGLDLNLNPFKRKRDKPVAYWSGITEVSGEKQFVYPVPDYFNGKIRVMAISVTPEKIGKAQTAATVRDSFIMTPNVPAMVAPGDEFDVSVGVSNNLEGLNGQSVAVNVQLTPPPQLEVMGNATQSLSLAEKREGVVNFRLRARAALGDAPLAFDASYGDKASRRTISTSVRPAMPYRTQSVMGRMSGASQNVDGLRQMFDAYAQRRAAVSHSPLVLTSGLAQYLADYPYYCSEQIVSRSIPLILQGRHPEMRGGLSQVEVGKQLRNLMGVLRSRQNDSGAIGAWRSSPDADPFVTPYVVQYLLEAKEAGYALPEGMLDEANGALRELAASGFDDLYLLRLRSWAVYLLTRQGEVTTNALAAVQDTLQKRYPDSWKTDLSALYLASSYRLLKMDDEAAALLQPSWQQLSKAYDQAWWTQNYFDPLVQDATRLYLITRHFPEKVASIPPQALENMVRALKEERYTTYSSAMSILALESYSTQVVAQATGEGGLGIEQLGKGGNAAPQRIAELQGLFAQGQFTADAAAVRFTNGGDAPAWYVVTQAGYDLAAPQKALARGLEITRDYTDEQGKPLEQVSLGQKVNVHLKIRANSKEGQSNLAIVDLLPGGFEVVQQTPPEPAADDSGEGEAQSSGWQSPLAASGSSWAPDYSDIREDRVIIYGSAGTDVQEFVYQIKATNTGSFVIPPAYGEAMYDREVQAMSVSSGKLVVVPAENK